jgi:hypothetical protein
MSTPLCARCQRPKHRGRCKGYKAAQSAKLAAIVERHTTPKAPLGEQIPTYGWTLRPRDDGYLDLEQLAELPDGSLTTDQLVLTREDIRQIAITAGVVAAA